MVEKILTICCITGALPVLMHVLVHHKFVISPIVVGAWSAAF